MSGQESSPKPPTRLKLEMESRALSVSQLSRKTGITEKSITRYRTGQVTPRDWWGRPSRNATLIALALQMDPDELFPLSDRVAA